MPICRACGYFLRGDADTLGARCRHCSEPLYEAPLASAGGGQGKDDAICALHAGNGALGTCARCGNFYCAVCRTNWHGAIVCPTCLERALETREAVPRDKRTQWLHAVTALTLGGGAWVVTVFGLILVAVGIQAGMNAGLLLLGMLLFMGGALPAVMGVGLGAAAIRARGSHMIIATAGLVLGGLHIGVLIGLFTFSIWMSLGG
jgi:hypothetical protein